MKATIPLMYFVVAVILLITGCYRTTDIIDVSAYDYRDTKNLVRMVADAARRIEHDGLSALDNFQYQPDISGGYYLYIYDMDDICLYHGGMPELVNQRLTEITDIEGQSISQQVREALADPENPHGWVHYTWWVPGRFYPVPKSSCHFKIRLPDGREVYVGGGLENPHEEREFIRIAIDSAVKLIESRGGDALSIIADPLSHYNYRDVRVFAFHPDGSMLISPVLGDTRIKMDLRELKDDAGNRPFERALQLLEKQPAVWQVFIEHSRDERQPVKKTLYIRRTILDNESIYLGAITDLPRPP